MTTKKIEQQRKKVYSAIKAISVIVYEYRKQDNTFEDNIDRFKKEDFKDE